MSFLTAVFAFTSTLAVAGPVSPLRLGGPEIDCAGTSEHWVIPGSTPTITWTFASDLPARMSRLAPGFPAPQCFLTGTFSTWPAGYSVTQGITTWNNATYPGLGIPAGGIWSYKFGAAPASYVLQDTSTGATVLNPLDGVSVITLLEPLGSFTGAGNPLGFAAVTVPGPSGAITDVDIAINCDPGAVDGGTAPSYGVTEFNPARNKVYFNSDIAPLTGFTFDLQGVLTHEMGHMVGLAHSFVDSETRDGSSFVPAMWPYALAQSYPWVAPAVTGTFATCATTNVLTLPAAIGGLAQRNLQTDDLAALGRNYPTTAFNTQLGVIVGSVYGDYQTPHVMTYDTMHVVAIKSDQPDSVRVGTLHGPTGTYRINGLPPGTYYVTCEPFDCTGINITPPTVPGYPPSAQWAFFGAKAVLPGYLQAGGYACNTQWSYTDTDIYNAEPTSGRTAQVVCADTNASSNAVVVTVVAGPTATMRNILAAVGDTPYTIGTGALCAANTCCPQYVDPQPLWVAANTGANLLISPRGIGITPAITTLLFLVATPVRTCFVGGGCGGGHLVPYGGWTVNLRFSADLGAALDPSGQLDQLGGTVVTVAGQTLSSTNGCSMTGIAPFPPPGVVPPGAAHTRIFVQAEYTNGTVTRRTNIVTVDIL